MARRRDPEFLRFMSLPRRRIAPTLPQPCIRCGRPVYREQAWDVGHRFDISLHPHLAMQADLVGPEHRAENRSHGGRLGAAVANRNRTRGQLPSW